MKRNYFRLIKLICRHLCILPFIILLYSDLCAQIHPEFFFDHYNPGDKLPSSQIISLCQGPDNTLWLGTDHGLLSFNGHNFKRWMNPVADQKRLPAHYILSVVADKKNNIWFTGHHRLYRLNPSTAELILIPLPKYNFDPIINKLIYDQKKDQICVLTTKGVFTTPIDKLALSHVDPLNKVYNTDFSDLALTPDGEWWLVNADNIIQYSPQSKKINQYSANIKIKNKPLKFDYLSLCYEHPGILWVGTWSKGLLKFNLSSQKFEHHFWSDIENSQNSVLQIIKHPSSGGQNTFWLSSTQGLVCFFPDEKKFSTYIGDNSFDPKTIHGSVFGCLADNRGNLWIGSYYGLHKYETKKQVFKKFSTTGLSEWINNIESMAFCDGRNGDSLAFISYSYGPLISINVDKMKDLPLPEVLTSYAKAENLIHEVHIDTKNRLWLSSRIKGLIRYDRQTKKIEKIVSKNPDPKDEILHILRDQDQNLWMVGIRNLSVFDESQQKLIPQIKLSNWLQRHNYSRLLVDLDFDENNRLWMIAFHNKSDLRSIVSYDPQTETILEYKPHEIPSLFELGTPESICHLGKNQIAVCGVKGIATFSASHFKIQNIRTLTESDRNILGGFTSIIQDYKGDLWINSHFGIAHTRLNTNVITHFNTLNSSITIDPGPFIAMSPNRKKLWIKQKSGFKWAFVDELSQDIADSIYLTALTISKDKDYGYRPQKRSFTLTYDQNSIEMQVSMYNFSGTYSNRFEYRLSKEDKWKAIESNVLVLSGMGPGTYKPEIRGINEHGIYSANTLQFYIHIKPPFWKTGWFFVLVLSMAISVIAIYFYFRESQHRRLENLRNTIARDLHDEMGSTLSQIKIMSELLALKTKDENFKIINRKIKEVMTTMSEIVWSINPKKDSLNETISKIQEFAIDILEKREIDLHFDVSPLPEKMILSPDQRRHLYLIFKEAINNTAKYAEAKNAWFKVSHKEGKTALIFADDGKGFDLQTRQSGNGLITMRERAKTAGFTFEIDSRPQGTQIKLTV